MSALTRRAALLGIAGQALRLATGTAEAAPGPEGTPTDGERVARLARAFLGYPYVWGGTGPWGFDCSGLVWYVYRRLGHPIPRLLGGQLASGPAVRRADLQPGDLVFFAGTYEPGLSHVGIHVGDGAFVNAADEDVGVILSHLSRPYWRRHYDAACRPLAVRTEDLGPREPEPPSPTSYVLPARSYRG